MGLIYYLAAAAAVGIIGLGVLAFSPKNGDRYRTVPDLPADIAECQKREATVRRSYEHEGAIAQCLAERRKARAGT